MTPTQIRDDLATLLVPRGFRQYSFIGPDPTAMGAWYVEFRSSSLTVAASQDRTGDSTSIRVGSLNRRAPRKQMRGPWSLSHLRGFLDNAPIHHAFADVSDQLRWLRESLVQVLDSETLNSDELNDWSISASRSMFASSKQNDL